jgi:hypothetical protein
MDWSYGITIYTIYAVWSIPVWIINHIMGIENLVAIPILIWYKLLLALFAVWSVYLVGKIAEIVCGDKKEEIQLQYVCSVFFVFPIFAIAQCDIIGLCFVLLGIRAYLQEENKKFILYFAVAMTMKYFALFIFIPLVLYRYRRLNKMAVALGAGIVLIAISMLIIMNSTGGSAAIKDDSYYVNNHMLEFNYFNIEIGNFYGPIGLFGLFYMITCIIAYIVPNNEKNQKTQYTIWLCLAGYMCFFIFYPCNFYWYILLAPFLILQSYIHPKKRKVNLLLEIIFTNAFILSFLFIQDWVFMGSGTFSYLGMSKIGSAASDNLIKVALGNAAGILKSFMPTVHGIIYASAFMLLILNFPGLKYNINESDEEIEQDVRIITWIRIAAVYIWIALAIVGIIKSQASYWFSGESVIEMTEDGLYAYGCRYSGELYDDATGGVWMGDEFNIQLFVKDNENIESDLKLTTYGYTMSLQTKVRVYVNDEYVGDLIMEDENENVTNRYIVIPKEMLTDKEEIVITLRDDAEMSTEDEEGNIVTLGVYFKNIYIQEI